MPEETATFEHFQIARREDGSLFELGRGAMGVTYKAYDTRLDGFVALKVINPGYLNDDVGRERFLREARAAAHLDHPNVAAIFHRGQEGGNYFYAMQFIEGETVDAFVRRRGPLPTALALRIVLQAAQGLAAANARGLIHRDIKPANLMLVHLDGSGLAAATDAGSDEDLLVKVIDFGLAKVVLDDKGGSELSLTGEGPIGTPYYMSPEQIDSSVGDVDARTDIYSLGVTLWYLLTGQPPFVGTQFQVFRQHISASPPMARLPATVPDSVRALLDRMMAKTPIDRPTNTRDLIGALRELLRGPLAPAADLNVSTLPLSSRADPAPLPPSVAPDYRADVPGSQSATQPLPVPTDTQRPPPPPFQAVSYQTPPPVPANLPAAFPPFPVSGNSGSTFPAGPYQPPPAKKTFSREWMIFIGVLVGALAIGGILLGYFVAKSKHDKTAASETPTPSSATPFPTTTAIVAAPTPGATPRPAASAANTPRRSSASDAAGSPPDANVQLPGTHTITVPGQYATIQAAIDAAKSGDTVKVASGTFREALVFKAGIRLLGAGTDETVVSTPGDGEALTAKNCASGTVTGFTFEHTGPNKASQASYVVWLDGSAIHMRNCRFRNSGSLGLGCENGDKSVVEGCEAVGSKGIGLRAFGAGTAPTFRNNHVHDNTGTGIGFSKGAGGTAENNVSENNSAFGFSILNPDTAPLLNQNTARGNKNSGFTYELGAGGVAQDNTAENNKEGGFRVADKGTAPKLVRNHITGSGLSGFIIVAGTGGVFDENTSEANASFGALVSGAGTAPTLTNNKLIDNKSDGIFINDEAAGTIISNTISGNSGDGVNVKGKGAGPTVRENQIRNNSANGIAVREGAGGVFEGNVCESNQYGIAVYGAGTSPMLNGNKTEGNEKDGVYVEKGATPKRSARYDGFFK